MREIKFRAWDGIKFYSPVHYGGMWYRTGRDFEDGHYTNDTVQQFTGLKDKNGKEIYEGDIVKLRGGRKPRNGQREFYSTEVIFINGMFRIKNNTSIFHDNAALNACEAVGNIYENPELLEQSS